MRVLRALLAICLCLSIAPEATWAQVGVETEKEMRAQWQGRCESDWDAATHMSKRQWEAVCRRVTDQRVKFRVEQQVKDKTRR